jgi:hypothetical protein
VRVNSTTQKDGSVTWSGRVKETGERAVLMLWANTMLTGYVAYQGTIFTLENAGGGVHASSEMNRGKLPPDHAPSAAHRDSASAADAPKLPPKAPPEPAVEPFPDDVRRALEAKPVTIDVMILYTPNAAKHYIRDPADLLALVIEEVNETYRNSGIGNVKLRLVHSQVVDYDGTKEDQFTHLYTMVDGLGPFKNVRKLRDEKKADIVGLIIDNPKGCGLSTRPADSDEAFFVVHHACAATTMSIGHEIGHILGARHDLHRREQRPRRLRARLCQRQQVARRHELQGGMRWLRAHSLLVQPEGHVPGRADRHAGRRQRPADPGARRARLEFPLTTATSGYFKGRATSGGTSRW